MNEFVMLVKKKKKKQIPVVLMVLPKGEMN